jgi:hypothetical protein
MHKDWQNPNITNSILSGMGAVEAIIHCRYLDPPTKGMVSSY